MGLESVGLGRVFLKGRDMKIRYELDAHEAIEAIVMYLIKGVPGDDLLGKRWNLYIDLRNGTPGGNLILEESGDVNASVS